MSTALAWVLGRAKGGAAARKDFRLGGELGVDFQPDHDFPFHA